MNYENCIIVDSDIFNMLFSNTDTVKNKNSASFFKFIFDTFHKKPVIHSYVYNNELFHIEIVKNLVAQQYISVIEYEEIFNNNENQKKQYIDIFCDFYKDMNALPISNDFNSIKKHEAKTNKGEIHSIITAFYFSIPIFVSNDKGAKNLVQSKINYSKLNIEVLDMCDICCKLKQETDIDTKYKKIIRALLKQRNGWLEKYNNTI